jgi:hypothetical protein
MAEKKPSRKWHEISVLLALIPAVCAMALLNWVVIGLLFAGAAWLVSVAFDLPLNSALILSFTFYVLVGVVWSVYSTWRGIRCPQCRRRVKTQKPLRCSECGGPAQLIEEGKPVRVK